MNVAVVQRLLALNRTFYGTCAGAFARSRGTGQSGLLRTLPLLPPAPAVLDLGCGNGRLARLLAQERPAARYTGVDASPDLLDMAAAALRGLELGQAHLVLADVTVDGWPQTLPPGTPYDAIYVLALLHHLPGFDLRAAVLRQAGQLLAPASALIASHWQFPDDPRWRDRYLPWDAIGLTADQVEPGDALLDWRREGRGLRYVHHVSLAEAHALAQAAALTIVETYYADGQSRRLNLFQICRP